MKLPLDDGISNWAIGLFRKRWILAFVFAELYMIFNLFAEVFFKFCKALAAIGDFFINEQDFAKECIVFGIYLNCTMIPFVHYGFLCQLFSPVFLVSNEVVAVLHHLLDCLRWQQSVPGVGGFAPQGR